MSKNNRNNQNKSDVEKNPVDATQAPQNQQEGTEDNTVQDKDQALEQVTGNTSANDDQGPVQETQVQEEKSAVAEIVVVGDGDIPPRPQNVFYGIAVSDDVVPQFLYLENYLVKMAPGVYVDHNTINTMQIGLYSTLNNILSNSAPENFNTNFTALLRFFKHNSGEDSALHETRINRGYEYLAMERERREGYLELVSLLINLSSGGEEARLLASRFDILRITRVLPEQTRYKIHDYFQ